LRLGCPGAWLVVIRDFDLVRISSLPSEANPDLVVDANAILTGTVPLQPFQAVSRRNREVLDIGNSIELIQLPPSNRPQGPRTSSPSRS
jgi:hypothetical protein